MSEYNSKSFRQEDINRIKQLVLEGVQTMQEIEDLNEGLNDTIKAVAEEIEVKPSQLKKAVRTAFKNSMIEDREKLDEIEDILGAAERI